MNRTAYIMSAIHHFSNSFETLTQIIMAYSIFTGHVKIINYSADHLDYC